MGLGDVYKRQILQRLADAAADLVSPTSPEVQPRPRKPKKNKRRVRLEQKLARPAHKPPREASSPPVLERPRAALAGDRLGRLSRSDGFINIGSRVRDEARRELERSGPVQARHSRSARAATRTLPPVSGARTCLLYTSPSPRDRTRSRMPSSA